MRHFSIYVSPWLTLAFACLLFVPVAVGETKSDKTPASEEKSLRAVSVNFLRSHMLGKKLVEPLETSVIEPGAQEAETQVVWEIKNLVEIPHGFQFDMLVRREQTNYDLNEAGERTGESRTEDRIGVVRHRVSERFSTGALVGIADDHYSDLADYPYAPMTLKIEANDKKLILIKETIHHQDLYAKGGNWTPGKMLLVQELYLQDGSPVLKTTERGFDLVPATGKFEPRDVELVSIGRVHSNRDETND